MAKVKNSNSQELKSLLKTYTKKQGEETRRYVGALHEDHLDKFKIIGEGLDGINQRLDRHEGILESHTEMIGQLVVDVSVLKTDVSTLKTDVGKLKVDMTGVKNDVKIIKHVLRREVKVNVDELRN